jgi:predicted transcriptional regulator
MMVELGTTKATIYRHLNKLKGLDIMEEEIVGNKKEKGYRFRYGNFAKAWNFVEAHVKVAMENYGETVEHLQELVSK